MDWKIIEKDQTPEDPTGVGGFVRRMEHEFRVDGLPLEGFHFMNSPMEMLRFSREIEEEVGANSTDANLYAGFQTVEKLIGESKRYRHLVETGVSLVAFGQGKLPESTDLVELEWVPLERDTRALENQWYLVSSTPSPIAFVGWETSPEDQFARDGLSAPGKMFKGFVTNDSRVVEAMLTHLESVRSAKVALHMARTTLESQLRTPIGRVMTITDGSDSQLFRDIRARAIDIARSYSAEVLLFEISAASYLVNPYPEEDRKSWLRVLDERELVWFGRSAIARQLAEIKARGIEAGAVLPTTHGFKHLAAWAEQESVDLILLPSSLVEPGLLDRLRGYSLRSLLEHTDRQVVLMEPDGTMWHANP